MTDPSHEWTNFTSKHQGHPFLDIDPLLAIPVEVLLEIEAKLPRLITGKDLEFETDLARADRAGFAFKRPINTPEGSDLSGHERLGREIRELWIEAVSERMPLSNAQYLLDELTTMDSSIPQLQLAYVGWLILNPQYRLEIARLKDAWHVQVAAMKRVPCHDDIPVWRLSESVRVARAYDSGNAEPFPVTDEQESTLAQVRRFVAADGELFLQELTAFYLRWELWGLRHWWLPIPALPKIPELEGSRSTTAASVTIPWYLTRDPERIPGCAARIEREFSAPQHLSGWLRMNAKSGSGIGVVQYARVEQLHRILTLTLAARYGTSRYYVRSKLDNVLGDYLNCGADQIKKLRLMLGRL